MTNQPSPQFFFTASHQIYKHPITGDYIACLNGFDTQEIIDGYTADELDILINILSEIKNEIILQTKSVQNLPLFDNID